MTARDRKVSQHAELAAKAFAEHKIRMRLNQGMFRSWRCQKPETWCYGFDITTTPGALLVTGDIGTLVVERTNDMISWASSAVRSIDYFAQKVPHEIATEKFDIEVAKEWIGDEIAECRRNYAEAVEFMNTNAQKDFDEQLGKLSDLKITLDEYGEHGFITELADSGLVDGCDWPNFKNYTSSFLWQREAVKWFIENMDKAT